eukprot:1709954-Amphidinium_carterae.1
MNIKLPTPTMYDGKSPQFNEWSEEVRSYLTVHNIHIDDLLDESSRSQIPMVLATMQRDAVATDLQNFNRRYPQAKRHGEDGYDDYLDRWEAKEKKKADILQFSQTLNYVLLHATKQGSEPHSIMRRVMRQANGHRAQQFSLLRAITQPTWDTSTKQFTKQYYKWLEDIGRYEAENGVNAITDHVKIATIVNNLKGPMGQQLMSRINQQTTFDEVHQWISNYFNSTYTGVDEDKGAIGNINEAENENNEEWYGHNEETEEYYEEYNEEDVKYIIQM